MKLNVNTPICDVTGKQLQHPVDGGGTEPMTLAHVIIQMSLKAPAQGPQSKPYTPQEQVQRFNTAFDAEKARKLDPPELEIGSKIAAQLIDDVSNSYGPIVAGQIIPWFENGKTESILDEKAA